MHGQRVLQLTFEECERSARRSGGPKDGTELTHVHEDLSVSLFLRRTLDPTASDPAPAADPPPTASASETETVLG